MTDKVPSDHVVIHQNHNGLKKGFSTCTPEKLLSLIDINRGIYEMITRFPHKFYADIDLEPVPEGFNQEEYLAKIIDAFGYFLPDIQFAISGSVSETRASFHLVAQNYVIADQQQREVCKQIAKLIHENDDDGVDWKVYTKGRQMKCINQAKPKKTNVQLPITHLDNPKAHLITSFMEGEQMPIPPIEAFSLPKKQQLRRVSQMLAHDDPVMARPNPEGVLWDELVEPEHKLTLLNLIPINKDFGHVHTWTVMNYCICNDIPQAAFFSWLDQKATSNDDRLARREKYQRVHWPNIENKLNACKNPRWDYEYFRTQDSMRRMLKRWYPNIEPKDALLANFKEYMTPKNVMVHDRIDLDILLKYRDTKFVGLTHPMGSGKTTALIDYLRYMDKSFLYIAHRVCVVHDVYERMCKAGVSAAHYQMIGRKSAEYKKKLLRTAAETPNVIICVNSLDKIIGRDKPFDIVIFDEVESAFNGLSQVSHDHRTGKQFFPIEQKRRIIDALCTSFQKAEQVFGLDAFLTQRWVNFCGGQGVILDIPPPVTPPRTLVEIEDYRTSQSQIIQSLKAGKKVFVSYPYKASMELLCAYLVETVKSETGGDFIQGQDYQFYNADVSDSTKKELGDVNEHWAKYKLIVVNTVLTAGVSYEGRDVDEVYLYAAPFSKPRDLMQVSYRCRAVSSGKVYLTYLNGPPEDAWKTDHHKVERDVYTQLMNDTMVEYKIENKRGINVFARKAYWNVDEPITKQSRLEALEHIIKDCKEKVGQLDWDSIEEITNQVAQNLERSHLICNDADPMERHQLRKFYFTKNFSEEIPIDLLKHIWNHGRLHVINACDEAMHDPDSFENIIRAANKWMFFPLVDEDCDGRKWKPIIPPEARARINKEITVRYEESSKKTASLLKKVYNAKYGVEIVRSKRDKNRHVVYKTPNSEGLEELYDQAKDYLIRRQTLPAGCQIPLHHGEE